MHCDRKGHSRHVKHVLNTADPNLNLLWDALWPQVTMNAGVWYRHVIDHFTCFSAGSIVTTKKAKEIMKTFIHCWISVRGPGKRLFSDNGGELNNDKMRDTAEKFNIEVNTPGCQVTACPSLDHF